jgi:hypothetical protein
MGVGFASRIGAVRCLSIVVAAATSGRAGGWLLTTCGGLVIVCGKRNKPVSTPARSWPSAGITFMASLGLASLSMAPFDFSRWSVEAGDRPKFRDLALTAEQVEVILTSKHGISEVLFEEFEHATKRGAVPHAFMKALIVFEEYGRDTSYSAIAAALEVSNDTAKEYLREARAAVRAALGIELVSAGDSVRLVVANDAREKAIRVLNVFEQHVEPALKKLQACTKSLAASNVPLALPARAMAILEASKVEEVA